MCNYRSIVSKVLEEYEMTDTNWSDVVARVAKYYGIQDVANELNNMLGEFDTLDYDLAISHGFDLIADVAKLKMDQATA